MSRIATHLAFIFAILMLGSCSNLPVQTPPRPLDALALLKAERFDELDRTYSDIQRRYKMGEITDVELRAAFRVFYATDPSLEREYDLWVTRHPRSYVARLARGSYFTNIGLEQRGPQAASQTTDEQFRTMNESFRKALVDLDASYALDAKPLLTYMNAMNISLFSGERTEMQRLLNLANTLDPSNVIARVAYMDCLRMRWGGNLAELNAFVEQSRKEGLPESKLRDLEAIAAEERGVQHEESRDYAAAGRDYRDAADLGREECLPCLANVLLKTGQIAQAIEVYTQELALKPGDSGLLNSRGAAYMASGKAREGLSDLNAAAQGGNAPAENQLGTLYMLGVPGILTADRQIGIEWFRKAAAQGDFNAIRNLDIASKLSVQGDRAP